MKNKGITLIALVVTVIILLILAGVTVSLVLGKNGLLRRAQTASNTMANATANESAQLSQYANDIDTLTSEFIKKGGSQQEGNGGNAGQQGGGSTAEFTITNLGVKPESSTDSVIPLSTEKTVSLADNKGNIVKVPKNFGIAYDSADNVADGIVIEYTGTTENDPLKGNQYVWVPVGQDIVRTNGETMPAITLGRYDFDAQWNSSTNKVEGTGAATLKQNADDWAIPTAFKPTSLASYGITCNAYEYSADNNDGKACGNTKASNLEDFINSVKNNHGYYIARYEAGAGASNGKPFSQKNKIVWNYLTQPEAAAKCQSIYEGAESDLVNSYAWDTTIVYIQKSLGSTAYATANGVNDRLRILNTGNTGDEQCKINDMARNAYEWTTESTDHTFNGDSYPCVKRGGNYNYVDSFTAYHEVDTSNRSSEFVGFRLILYV